MKVVFVTANPAQIASDCGALGYIRKPFCEEAIRAAAALAFDGVAPGDAAVTRFTRYT